MMNVQKTIVLTAVLLLLFSACDRTGFDDPHTVDTPRILAVKTDPGFFTPGTDFTASTLMSGEWKAVSDITVEWHFGNSVFVNTDSFSVSMSESEMADYFSAETMKAYNKSGSASTDINLIVKYTDADTVRTISATTPLLLLDSKTAADRALPGNPSIEQMKYSINDAEKQSLSPLYISAPDTNTVQTITLEPQTRSGIDTDSATDFSYRWYASRTLTKGEIPPFTFNREDGSITIDLREFDDDGLLSFSVIVEETADNIDYNGTEMQTPSDFTTVSIDIGTSSDDTDETEDSDNISDENVDTTTDTDIE